MPLDSQATTLAGAPYFDDFTTSEASNYHRILFKPSVAVQARELTQLQTILQTQIERFGDNIYKRGTILSGCNIFYDPQYNYIKLTDTQISGQSVEVSEYANTLLQSENGLQALVVNYTSGLVAQAPDLNTLYVKYINVGTATASNGAAVDVKVFSANSIVTSYNRDRRVERVTVDQGGTGYANTDSIVFTANNDSGAGAQATLTTYSNGTIRSVTMTSRGTGYINPPAVSVVSSSGVGSILSSINYVGQLQIANSTFDSVGQGFAVLIDNGYAYQKGHFIKVADQTLIAEKYKSSLDGYPNNAVIGFKTIESIANSSTDSTLNDNATGSTNEGAPGADRLQLTATLVSYTPTEADADPNFMTLVEFQTGTPVRTNTDTQFNSIEKAMARRTFEESGNYAVKQFNVYGEEKLDVAEGSVNTFISNTTHLNLVVSPGIAYVDGIRTEIFNNYKMPIRKATDTALINNQLISTGFGNYVYVSGFAAASGFNPLTSTTVTLYDTAINALASGSVGSIPAMPSGSIGTAKIRGIEYDSGVVGSNTAIYKAYLYDIKMTTGKSFTAVRSIGATTTVAADIVVTGNTTTARAVLNDVTKDGLVFTTGTKALKSVSDVSLIYRTVNNNVTFASSGGNSQISFGSGGISFPYTPGSTLTTAEKNEFIVVPTSSALSVNLGGSVSVTSGSNAVVGTSTAFTTKVRVGDMIFVGNSASSEYKRVTNIESDLKLYVDSNLGTTNAAWNVAVYFPADQPLNLARNSDAKIVVDNANTVTISLGTDLQTTMPSHVYHNATVSNPSPKTKKIRKGVFVKLAADLITANPNGPWCLGIPDVHKITGVYTGTGTSYADPATSTNYSTQFELNNGQTDNIYGLSYLRRAPSATITTTGGVNLLVKMDVYYDHGAVTSGAYFAGPASYPIDDVNREANTAAITTEEIELFTSPRTGAVYDLRNAIDFRPVVANTADASATSAASATVLTFGSPGTTENISVTTNYFPNPTKYMSADLEYYLPRLDVMSLTSATGVGQLSGTIIVTEGVAKDSPSTPRPPENSMVLATVAIPPYPSLDPINAQQANRSDLAVKITSNSQQKRYTMKDIGDITQRIDRLEYYSLLNRLETSSKDLAGSRTLNGFFVDSFNDFEMSNLSDTEFNAFVDTQVGQLRPRIYSETIDLKLDTSQGSLTTGINTTIPGLLMIDYTTTPLVRQTFASKIRNTAAEFWRFRGQLFLYPKYDGQYDRSVAPTNIMINIAGAQQAVVDAVNKAFLQMDGRATVEGVSVASWISGQTSSTATDGGTNTTTIVDTRTVTTGRIEKANLTTSPATTTLRGAFNTITDVEFKPFMRSAPITFFATGLRPGARHYVYFDGQDVNAQVIPGTYNGTTGSVDAGSVTPTGGFGAELRSDENGQVAGIFYIPADTFYVGERTLTILDVGNINSQDTAVSFCSSNYNAYNVNVDHQQVSISTQQVENINANMLTTYKGVLTDTTKQSITTVHVPPPPAPRNDPLSQTFLLPQDIKDQTDGVFISKVDLFFQSVGANRGVTVQIRDVVNGYPGPNILPFATKWNPPSLMTTSETAATASTFTFDNPVFINTGQEYALVVIADGGSPDFYIWTGEAGQADVTNKDLIVKSDWGYGQLFTSVNNTAWNPHSFEDLKFNLHRAKFTVGASATAALTHDNYEFLTLADISGNFTRGEKVAQKASSFKTGTLNTSNSSVSVTGTGTAFTSELAASDTLLITYGITPGSSLTGTVSAATTAANLIGTSTTFGTDVLVGETLLINGNVRKVVNISNTTNLTLDAPVSNTVTANSFTKFSTVQYDIADVAGITGDTSLTLSRVPKYTTNSTVYTAYMKVVAGEVDRYRAIDSKLYLKKSNAANGTFKFVQSSYSVLNANSGRQIVGGLSNTSANVVSTDNISINYIDSEVRTITPTGTGLSAEFRLSKPGETTLTPLSGVFMGVTTVPFASEIRSRSNELVGTSIVPSFKMIGNMQTTTEFVSPVIDISPAHIQVIRNVVDNYKNITQLVSFTTGSATITVADGTALAVGMGVRGQGIKENTTITNIATNTVTLSANTTQGPSAVARTNVSVEFHANETTRYGISKNKYVSKYMQLADGMEAEDFALYATAYRPVGTDVDIYARFINSGDGEDMNRKEWTLLQLATNQSVYSDPTNTSDYKEYKYVVPKTPPFTNLTGRANTASSNVITGDTTSLYKVELAVGDLVKIVKNDANNSVGAPVYGETDNYEIKAVTSITSNTVFNVDSAVSHTTVGVRVQKVTQPRAAFLYNSTSPSYILTYHGAADDGTTTAQYRGYKYVAIKVVTRALSSGTSVPTVKDVRALSMLV